MKTVIIVLVVLAVGTCYSTAMPNVTEERAEASEELLDLNKVSNLSEEVIDALEDIRETTEETITEAGGYYNRGEWVELSANTPAGYQELVVGQSLTLTCTDDPPGWPKPKYRWWRVTNETNTTALIMGSTFTISSVSTSDTGLYFCQPFSPLANGTRHYTHVLINQPPTITEFLLEAATYQLGEKDFNLTCRVQGVPLPTMKWLKNGKYIVPDNKVFVYNSKWIYEKTLSTYTLNSTLEFRGNHRLNNELLPSDHGTYTCLFENEIGNASSSQLIKLEYPPIGIHNISLVAADLAKTAQLECRIMAVLVPHFQWFHHNKTIVPDKGHLIVNNNNTGLPENIYSSVLSVEVVTEADYGGYTCKASNKFGDHISFFTLQQRDRPDIPSDLYVVARYTKSIQLAWKEGFNGGFKNTNFHVQIKWSPGQTMNCDCQTHNPCYIRPLPLNTPLTVKVRASNDKGMSNYSMPIEDMTLLNYDIPELREVFWNHSNNLLSFKVFAAGDQILRGKVEVQQDEDSNYSVEGSLIPITVESHYSTRVFLNNHRSQVRVQLCSPLSTIGCGNYTIARKVEMRSSTSSGSMPMGYIAAILVVSFFVIVAFFIICCCCQDKNKPGLQGDKIWLFSASSIRSLSIGSRPSLKSQPSIMSQTSSPSSFAGEVGSIASDPSEV